MKHLKLTLAAILVIFTSSCSTAKLVMKSDHVISNKDQSIIIIKDSDHGKMVYEFWKSGLYGEPLVLAIIDSTSFYDLNKKL
jgi:hypothetical protein